MSRQWFPVRWPRAGRSVPKRNRVFYESLQGPIPCILIRYKVRHAHGLKEQTCTLRPIGPAIGCFGPYSADPTADIVAPARRVWRADGVERNRYSTQHRGFGWRPADLEVTP